MSQILGRVKGPSDRPHTFKFIAPDPEQLLKSGEFISYDMLVDNSIHTIFARVTERFPLRVYPDGFMGNPQVDPKAIAETLGYHVHNQELFEITGETLGYFDEMLRDFVNPRIPPRLGTAITKVPDDTLARILSRVAEQQPGAASIGWLASRSRETVPIAVDVAAITSTHLAIIASTGAGKSYTASVLIEEMLMPHNRAAILVIDPHGEYNTLGQLPNQQALWANGYRPEARIYKPNDLKLRVGTLDAGDLRYLLPNLSERMEYILAKAMRNAQRASAKRTGSYEERWTRQELLDAVEYIGEHNENGEEDDRYKGTADALIWRLNSILGGTIIFDDVQQTKLDDLLRPGRCTVLQFDHIDSRQQQVVVAGLLRRIYQARVAFMRGESLNSTDDLYLPYPVFVLIEEAHHFAPAGATTVSTGILKQILAEGRKFGVGVGLISQRPGKIDADVLSQCNTQFLMRIINPVDQARVAESIESLGRELLAELPALNKGQAIIAGAAIITPVLCNIRPRLTPHGANDIHAPSEWLQYFDNAKERERNQALPAQRTSNDSLLRTRRT